MVTKHGENRSGFALMMVLAVLAMAVVVGLSYAMSASVKLASSQNLLQMAQAKYIAESGLQHAMYLLEVQPELLEGTTADDPLGPYYADATNASYILYAEPIASNPGEYAIYAEGTYGGVTQKCQARVFRSTTTQTTTTSALLVGGGTSWLPLQLTINGDFHVNGNLVNMGQINGDASARGFIVDFFYRIQGSKTPNADEREMPGVEPADYDSYYVYGSTYQSAQKTTNHFFSNDPLSGGGAITPSNPGGVVVLKPSGGTLVRLRDNVQFQGTMVIDGDLELKGNNVQLTAVDKYPALIVKGKIYVRENTQTTISGLVVAGGGIVPHEVSSDSQTEINGGLVAGSKGYDLLLAGQHTLNYDSAKCEIYDFRRIAGMGRVEILTYGE